MNIPTTFRIEYSVQYCDKEDSFWSETQPFSHENPERSQRMAKSFIDFQKKVNPERRFLLIKRTVISKVIKEYTPNSSMKVVHSHKDHKVEKAKRKRGRPRKKDKNE